MERTKRELEAERASKARRTVRAVIGAKEYTELIVESVVDFEEANSAEEELGSSSVTSQLQ